MNILHVIPYMHPHAGGPAVYVDRLARAQGRVGHAVTVLTTDAFFTGEEEIDRRLLGDAPYGSVLLPAGRANRPGPGGRVRAALTRALEACDVLHVHTLWSWLVRRACVLAGKLERPWVQTPHGMLDPHALATHRLRKRLYLRWVEQKNLRGARCLCFTSRREAQLAVEGWHPVRELVRQVTVPGAVVPPAEQHPALAERFRAAHGLAPGERVLLFLSRVHPKKGLPGLLRAFSRLAGERTDWRLVVAGPGPRRYVQRMRSLAAGLEHPERVHFVGPLAGDDKWGAFAAADLFVLPSEQENFGLVVAEAMHMGVPTLVSSRVNSGEHVIRGRAGRVYDFAGGEAALERALGKLMDLPADGLAGLGRNGPPYAAERLTWARCAEATDLAYARALAMDVDERAAA